MRPDTRLVRFDPAPGDPHRPTATPIYQTATFAQPDGLHPEGHDYSRSGNPTRAVLEGVLADLEQATHAFAFASGMAAVSAVARLVPAGGRVVAGDDLYGGTWRLLARILARYQVQLVLVDPADLGAWEAALPGAHLALVETPTNPLLRVVDLEGLATRCRAHGVPLAVDNSVMSPLLQQPLALGADLVIHSATKFLGGHSDLTAGAVCTSDPDLAEALYLVQNGEGAGLGPFDSFLLLRGIKTLSLRLERQQANTRAVARALVDHRAVRRVHWVGLPDHPGAALHARQATGAGSVLSFETGSPSLSAAVVDHTRCFTTAVSFGGVASSIELPGAMSHASIPDGQRSLPRDLVRVSVGIEDPLDLVEDLVDSLDRASRQTRRGALAAPSPAP